jgi:hypothetical protein
MNPLGETPRVSGRFLTTDGDAGSALPGKSTSDDSIGSFLIALDGIAGCEFATI